MVAFQKHLGCALGIILMISTVSVQVTGEEVPFMTDGEEMTDIRVNPKGGVFFSPEALSNPTGYTSAGSGSACFPKPPVKTTFNRGESVWFNVYWQDTVEADRQNVYNVTMAVQAGTLLVFLQDDFDIDTGTTPPGTRLEFCVAAKRTIPSNAATGPHPWGARVIKLQDNTKFQQQLNTITIQGAKK